MKFDLKSCSIKCVLNISITETLNTHNTSNKLIYFLIEFLLTLTIVLYKQSFMV